MVDEKKETKPEVEKNKTGEPKKQKASTAKKSGAKQSAAGEKKPAQKAAAKKTASAEETKKRQTAKKTPVGEAGKGLAAISYISILFLIPMISMRDNRFAMFHAKQSMVLVISTMVLFLGLFILGVLTSWLGIGIILILLAYVVLFVYLVFMIIGFVKAFSGEYWRIPKIADWADKVKI